MNTQDPELPEKYLLKEELLSILEEHLAALEQAHAATLSAATHEEAKPENDKDTRALEQSYLARGQALRVAELRTGVAEVRGMACRAWADKQPIGIGALIWAEEDGRRQILFMAPQGGGTLLAEKRVQVVTPKSAMGRALLGRTVGEEAEATIAERERYWSILRIA